MQTKAIERLNAISAKSSVKDILDTGGALSLPGAVTETSLNLPVDMTLHEWAATGYVLDRINKAWKFWFGDWLNYGEDHWPEEYAQYIDITDLPEQSISNIRSVARNIPPHMRNKDLKWSLHAAVVPLKDEGVRMQVINQAAEEQWPRDYLRQVVKVGGDPELLPPAVVLETEDDPGCQCFCTKSDFCKECGHPWGS